MYLVAWCATIAGRWPSRLILGPIAVYYYLVSARARRAVVEFYTRLRGQPPSHREVFRNILRFAQVALDRLFFVVGKTQEFQMHRVGSEYLAEHLTTGRGGVLMGAHLGSFAAMSGAGELRSYRINAVMYNANSKVINSVLERFGGSNALRTIDISRDRLAAVLTMKKRIEKGEFVALLVDRVIPGSQSTQVNFLGGIINVSTGGFVLASVLKCPVYLVFGLYRGANQYDLFCEPFADEISLPRGAEKQQVLNQIAQKYADRLAHYCALAPDNWFNFYSFWEPEKSGSVGDQ